MVGGEGPCAEVAGNCRQGTAICEVGGVITGWGGAM